MTTPRVPDHALRQRRRLFTMSHYKRPAHTPVTVRCDACAGVFADTLDIEHPCPHCGKLARGAA